MARLLFLIVLLGFIAQARATSPQVLVKTFKTPFQGSVLYTPNNDGSFPGVMMFHGSEGGSQGSLLARANLLAANGFAVLVYCYFDCNRDLVGSRETLKSVKVETVFEAAKWLKEHKLVAGKKIAFYGFSRGAELTMILGANANAFSSKPDALIAHSPSDVVVGPFNWDWNDNRCWICLESKGCPNFSDYTWNNRCSDNPRTTNRDIGAWSLNGQNLKSNSRIEIEKYDGPILLTHGRKDNVWPVEQTERIEETLRKAGRTPEVHYFPNAGHGFFGKDEMKRKQLVLDFLSKHLN